MQVTPTKEVPTLFTIWDTPIKVKPAVFGNLFTFWGTLSWLAGRRRPERSWSARLLVGALSVTTLMIADIGHAMAHIISARYAGAPMDELLVSPEMPRTLYFDNNVPPHVHRMRALGGPIYSTVGLLSSLILRTVTPRDSLARELAGWSSLGHGFILGGSLMPLPMVDGGAILKWTLVERGRTPAEADAVVQRLDLTIGTTAATAGVALAARHRWLPALGLVAAGAIAIASVLGRGRSEERGDTSRI